MTETDRKKEHLEMYLVFTVRLRRLKDQRLDHPECTEKLDYMIFDTLRKLRTIEEDVEGIYDLKEREVVACRYLCGKSIEEISEIMNYSNRQTERFLRKGIEDIRVRRRF